MSTRSTSALRRTVPQGMMHSDRLVFGLLFALSLTVVQRLLGFARGVLFCHFLTDQQLGQFSLVYSWLLTLAPLAVLGLPGSFGRYLEDYRQQGTLGSFLAIVSRISLVSTLLLAGFMLAFPGFFSMQMLGARGHVDLIWASALALVALTGFNYLVSLVEALRQIRLASSMRFVSGVGFTLLGVGALWAVQPEAGTLSAVVAFGASSLLGAIPAVWYLRRYRQELADRASRPAVSGVLWRIGPYAAWWWLSNLLQNLYELADRFMLVHWTPAHHDVNVQAVVGQYHSARVLPFMLMGLAEMVRGLLLPYLSAAWVRGDAGYVRQQLNWAIKLTALGLLAVGCVLLLTASWIFDTLLQGRYADGLAVLPLTMVYCVWSCLATVGQDYLWLREKGRWANAVFAMGLVANLGFNAWLIPWYGLWGAVVATSIANALVLLGLFAANWAFDCRLSNACGLAAASPLLLLLPAWVACLATVVVIAAALTTNGYFTRDERRQLWALTRSRFSR